MARAAALRTPDSSQVIGARTPPEHRPHFADNLQLPGESSRLPSVAFGYEELGSALAVCVSEEGDLGAQARLGLFVFSALQNLCVRNAEKAISEKEDLASISLRLRSGFLRGIRVNDVQALWGDKWLCAATRREVEDRLQFVSASRARDRLWVGSYMRVVQSEPERRRSWLSHDRSLWWWASGGTSSAPPAHRNAQHQSKCGWFWFGSPGGVVRRVLPSKSGAKLFRNLNDVARSRTGRRDSAARTLHRHERKGETAADL